jgi:serine/threonine protein kinase/predicted negative regulator of RcsB-dependent stress response
MALPRSETRRFLMQHERLERIDELFQSALDLPAEQRSGFVNDACRDDPELRKEVESLLKAHDEVGDFIEESASDVAAKLLGEQQVLARLGQVIDQYQVERLMGAGGMGEVYVVTDKLGRKLALKLLRRELGRDASAVARFHQEAQTLLTLNHPNIVTIYDIGQTDDVYYIASELVEGETLRQRLERSDLELQDILEIGIEVASALAAAHEKGIVHRDIKPENIMIRRDRYVKVLDFGIAKLTEGYTVSSLEAPTIRRVHTAEGTVIGTASYMSPEQARGLLVDARTDIWSLGVVLYETIASHKPFSGDTTQDVITAVLEKQPPPLARYAHDVPETLEWIISRALRKEREARYQTATELLNDLKELKRKIEFAQSERSERPGGTNAKNTRGPASEARTAASSRQPSTSSAEYVVSGIKQHKMAALIALMVIAAAIVGLAAYLHARANDVAIESIAVLPFQNRSTEADTDYLSDGLAESLIYRLSQLPNLKVSPTSLVFRYQGKEIDPIKVGNELGVSAVLSGRITQRGDNLTISAELVDVRNNKLLWGEQYDRKTSELLATQREIAAEIVDNLRLKVSRQETGLAKHYTESNEAFQLYLKGRFYFNKRTEEGMHKSLEYFQQAIDKDPNFALAYTGMADTYDLLGAQDAGGSMPPNEALPKAKAAAQKALEIDEKLAEPHVSLGHVKYQYDRDWPAAEREFKRAIELNPNYPLAHHWYAIFLSAGGRDDALAEIRRAQELDPLSLPINMWLGVILAQSGRLDEGIDQLRKTVEMDQNFVLAHNRLGALYEEKGTYDEALAQFRQVLKLSEGKPLGIAALAHANALAGKREEAQKNLAELLQMSKERYVSPTSIGLVYAALGDKDHAFAWLDEADKAHDALVIRLKVDPRFASLRRDPRFTDLVRRIGLPQ